MFVYNASACVYGCVCLCKMPVYVCICLCKMPLYVCVHVCVCVCGGGGGWYQVSTLMQMIICLQTVCEITHTVNPNRLWSWSAIHGKQSLSEGSIRPGKQCDITSVICHQQECTLMYAHVHTCIHTHMVKITYTCLAQQIPLQGMQTRDFTDITHPLSSNTGVDFPPFS